jgi:hypothetical protein
LSKAKLTILQMQIFHQSAKRAGEYISWGAGNAAEIVKAILQERDGQQVVD